MRDALHQLYLGEEPVGIGGGLAQQALVHSFDPRNASLEPEYYGDVDPAKYAERKPLIWFWMMYDRSPVGLNHWLGFRMRAMLARHVFKHCGNNVKIFHGVEITFGYNLTVEDNCTIHKYVLLDDRGELIIHAGSSVSDYANVYTHAHDLNDGMLISNLQDGTGPARPHHLPRDRSERSAGGRARNGRSPWAWPRRTCPPYHVVGGIPAKTIKVKTIAPDSPESSRAQPVARANLLVSKPA